LSSLYTFNTNGGVNMYNVNLTAAGDLDWIQFPQNSDTNYAKKSGGAGLFGFRRDRTAVPGGELGLVQDGRIMFDETDADPSAPAVISRRGLSVRGVGNYLEFKVAESNDPRFLLVYSGNWCAQARIDYIVSGNVRYTTTFANVNHDAVYCATIYVEPGVEGTLRQTLTNNTNYGAANNGSTFIFAAALCSTPVLDKTSVMIREGATDKITASPSDGVIWTSSAPDVASVDQNGIVTAIKTGDAVITAKLGSAEKTCNVKVIPRNSEVVAGGYIIDMTDLPKVHFANHPEWEEIYEATWQMHKSNIMQIPAATNPERPYYVDEAFSGNIFVWDTLLMMMFDKWGLHQFPTLPSMDNFYMNQTDSNGEDDGYIPREIIESTGRDYHNGYTDPRSMNPPLWAWAEWEQFMIHGDVSRFNKIIKGKTIYERMESHFAFIERYKKLGNGLYGKQTGLGNGLDNTFNQGTSGDNETYNDLSIQQAQFAYYLAKIAGAMGNAGKKAYYESEHARITALITEKLWVEETKMFSNITHAGAFRNCSTPTTLWALSAHVASRQQADALIKYHGWNSQKMFRPFGLATTAYDDSRYQPEGGYWRGAFWAPTSYVYIKGLEENGYDTLTFEEAIRHLTSVSDVYQAGKSGGYVSQATIWENYSSEYMRNGFSGGSSNSRPNFAGWTGGMTIGIVLEDVLGVRMNAPENTINWNIRLTEEHGVSDIYYKHNGVANRVNLLANARASAKDPVTFTVKTDNPFTLNVKNGSIRMAYSIPAGTSILGIAGESGKTARLDIGYSMDFSDFESSKLSASMDYVMFGPTQDTTVYDGLSYQVRKGADLIKNVNTIGFSQVSATNPPTYRDSAELRTLGAANAREAVKAPHLYGNEGFMFTVPANNELQTVTMLIGVTGGEAEISAMLLDASAPNKAIRLAGGDTESVYAVSIPYRAAKDGHHMLVKFTHIARSGSARIALKAIVLNEGGLMASPANFTVEPRNASALINAEPAIGDRYDSWRIYYGTSPGDLSQSVTAASMPYTLAGLTNSARYYIAVAGVTGGAEGLRTAVMRVIPEERPLTDLERATMDIDAAIPLILNGNEQASVKSPLAIVSVGPVYDSAISFISDSNGVYPGIWNTGEVEMPIGRDKPTTLMVSAVYNGTAATRNIDLIIPAVDFSKAYVLDTTISTFTGNVFLTQEGSKDWIQFTQVANGTNPQARKRGGTGIGIPRLAFPSPDHKRANGLGLTYVYDAADAVQTNPAITNGYAVDMRGRDDYIEIDLAYSAKPQRAYVYFGLWRAGIRADFVVNGAVVASEAVSDSRNQVINYRVGFDYLLGDPGDKASLRLVLANDSDYGGNGSIIANAITLQEIESSLHYIPIESSGLYGAGIMAEHFAHKSFGIDPNIENCGLGGKNVGGVGAGAWLTYDINVEKRGVYQLAIEFAAQSQTNPGLTILLDDKPIGSITQITPTGGWQNWAYRTIDVVLPAGEHVLKLSYANAGTNLRSLNLKYVSPDIPQTNVTLAKSNGALVAGFTIGNSSGSVLGAQCIIAFYDSAGRLTDMAAKTVTAAAGDGIELEVVMPFKDTYARAFIWNAETFIPLCTQAELSG